MDDDFWDLPFIQHANERIKAVEVAEYKEIHCNENRPEKEAQFVTTVHGVCRKCKSSRLTILNKQLRSADEGMTEIVHCQDCGYTRRTNS